MSSKKANPYVKAVTGAPASMPKADKKEKKKGKKPAPVEDDDEYSAALRAEVLALGGDAKELDMLLDADSDSEFGGEEGSDEFLAALRAEVAKLGGNAANFKPQESESEEEDADEEEESESEIGEIAQKVPEKKIEEKKESKVVREERRMAEREERRKAEQQEKEERRATERIISLPKSKSPWTVDPTPQWYAVPTPTFTPTTRPAAPIIARLQKQATTLLERENSLYSSSLQPRPNATAPPPPNGLSKSDQVFIQQILTSGTSSDKVSALLLLVSSSPLHTMQYLDQLASLAKKKSREESGRAIRGLVDWWRGEGGGAPSRKLRVFAEQPGLGAVAQAQDALDVGKSAAFTRLEVERCLVLWAFEDWLKAWFFEILKALELMSVDPLPHPRTLAVMHLSNLLRDKPEQEGNLLRLLVNKLGDTQRSIASKTSHQLLQILQFHPGMTPILVREVSSLILRPTAGGASSSGHVRFGKDKDKTAERKAANKEHGHDHARYYGVITLNQVMLNKSQGEVAAKMIDVYFQIFGDILGRITDDEAVAEVEKKLAEEKGKSKAKGKGKKGRGGDDEKAEGEVTEADSKLVAAVLTGVNRAFPYAKLDDDAFKKRLDILFRITHTGTFNVSIQALMLIYHVSAAKRAVSDRFYRTLYASLFDPRLANSSKQALYLNLVLKALKQDPNAQRVTALLKRLVQVMVGMEVTFILGSIWIVGELIATVPGLRKILTEPESAERNTVATAASNGESSSAPHPNDGGPYDGKKREPQFANAQNSCLWELVPLLNHYHPSVVLAAENLLAGEPIPDSGDLEQHSLNHFLDRFVYREVKKVASTKGSSMMQSGVSGQDRSGRIVMKKGPARGDEAVVNSEAFKSKDAADVPVDQLFFHTFFSAKSAQAETRSKASKKRKSRKDQDDEDSSSDESIGDLGFSDKEDNEAFPEMDDWDPAEEEKTDEEEEEIWKAMKETMPAADGDSDLDDPDEDDEDDDDLAEFDYSDSDEEAGAEAGGARKSKSAFADEDDFDGLDDDDTNLIEDEDDLIGSDEDMPMFDQGEFGEDSEEEEGAAAAPKKGKKLSKKEQQKNKKQKLKHLPMFGTAEEFAHLLGDSDDDGDV